MNKLELQLLSTEEVLTELFSRFPNATFVGQKEHDNVTASAKKVMWRYKGDPFLCLGLSSTLESILNEDIATHTNAIDPGNL